MQMRTVALLFLLLVGIFKSAAAVACALAIDTIGPTSWSGGRGLGYEVFDPTTYYQPMTFRVRAIEGSCAFYVGVGPANGASNVGEMSGTGGRLAFSVYREANDAQTLRSGSFASPAEVITGSLSERMSATYQITYSIPAQQVVGGGAYAGDVEIAVYEGNVGAGVLRAQQVVPLSVLVPTVAEISFAEGRFDPNYGVYLLNFNTMRQGDRKGVTLHTRTNGGYRIYLRSMNGGVMRQLLSPDNSAVPYSLTVDGHPIPISEADMQVIAFPTNTGPSGNAHRIDVQIGDIAGASAGDYYDLISISIYSYR